MTYLPPHFEETDTAALHALVGACPLAVPHQGAGVCRPGPAAGAGDAPDAGA